MDRCECVKCLGTLTQNFRTRQRHMEKYGCSERANQQCAERTPNSRLAAHSSPTPSTPVNDNEHSPTFGSQSEQLDPDYDPILQQQMNPSDTESDSENGKLMDEDSSDDERPIMENHLGAMSNDSDNESNMERDDDCVLPGLMALLECYLQSVIVLFRLTLG